MSTRLIKPLILVALAVTAAACSDDNAGSADTHDPETRVEAPNTPSFVVQVIQESLDLLGYDVGAIDGVAGPQSHAALASFQTDAGLDPTGNLDGATTIALAEASPDSRQFIVEAVQTQLAELGYYKGLIDGAYGPETEAALTAFHVAENIDETGSISEETLTQLTVVYIEDVLIPTQEASGYVAADAPPPGAEGFLRQGDESPEVQEAQEKLTALGYRPGTPDGRFGAQTSSAVLAFQKHEGLQRDGIVGPEVVTRLDDPQGAGPRNATGPRIEVDLDRQIAFIVDSGGSVTTINISSGSGREYTEADGSTSVAYTPTGEFVIEREIDDIREAPLGSLYRPKYFKEGWAIHGSPNVPAYPASHGCIRTSNVDQDYLFPIVGIDDPVVIYGTSLGEPDGGSPGF